ncbi:unnamed protein product [Closterium sp. NIES-64]|nr:unnamed protein product [Closterium sp. NIES-64]
MSLAISKLPIFSLLLILSPIRCDARRGGGPRGRQRPVDPLAPGGAQHAQAVALFKAWSYMYGLVPRTNYTSSNSDISTDRAHVAQPPLFPPRTLRPPPGFASSASASRGSGGGRGARVPLAPHMENCAALSRAREAAEMRGPAGEMPAWARPSNCSDWSPDPPWIRGTDAANLAMTRVVQTDLWGHQFPPPGSCSSEREGARKLLVVAWPPVQGFGIGAQMHIMSAALSLAVAYDRVLTVLPGSFEHAAHAACRDTGHPSSLSCYFLPISSLECERAGAAAVAEKRARYAPRDYQEMKVALASDEPAFYIAANFPWSLRFKFQADAASLWSSPWYDRPITVHHVGGAPAMSEELLKVHWWRSQSVRFFLRSPTAYLCHLTNAARHHTYGFRVALSLTAAAAAKSAALEILRGSSSSGASTAAASGRLYTPACTTLARRGDAAEEAGEGEAGQGEGRQGEAGQGEGRQGEAGERGTGQGEVVSWAGLSEEPYLPRPIVSVHVRQGDKAGEMRLLPLRAFVAAAQHMRRNAPNLNHIWLSTEMQARLFASLPPFFFLVSSPAMLHHSPAMLHHSLAMLHHSLSFVIPSPVPQSEVGRRPRTSTGIAEPKVTFESTQKSPVHLSLRSAEEEAKEQHWHLCSQLCIWPFLHLDPSPFHSPAQSVVEEAKEQHRDWTFLFTQNPRQEGTMTMHEYEAAVGADVLVGLSFVNLIIASQCDYFVGTLGSNWNRLIDELRCTNGRLFSGYLALNHGQWR